MWLELGMVGGLPRVCVPWRPGSEQNSPKQTASLFQLSPEQSSLVTKSREILNKTLTQTPPASQPDDGDMDTGVSLDELWE